MGLLLTEFQRSCPNLGFQPGPLLGVGRGAVIHRGGYGVGFRGGFVGGTRQATCYKCGGPNHYARDCQAQAMKCYACGKLVSFASRSTLAFDNKSIRAISRVTVQLRTEDLSTQLAKYATNVAKQGTYLASALRPKLMVRLVWIIQSTQSIKFLHWHPLPPSSKA